jgi:hypothetical protein
MGLVSPKGDTRQRVDFKSRPIKFSNGHLRQVRQYGSAPLSWFPDHASALLVARLERGTACIKRDRVEHVGPE